MRSLFNCTLNGQCPVWSMISFICFSISSIVFHGYIHWSQLMWHCSFVYGVYWISSFASSLMQDNWVHGRQEQTSSPPCLFHLVFDSWPYWKPFAIEPLARKWGGRAEQYVFLVFNDLYVVCIDHILLVSPCSIHLRDFILNVTK